jgi:hypothetical protein
MIIKRMILTLIQDYKNICVEYPFDYCVTDYKKIARFLIPKK